MFLQAFYLQVGYFIALKRCTDGFSFSLASTKMSKPTYVPSLDPPASATNDLPVRVVPLRNLERYQF
jgi:hypothetical protein